MFSRGERMVDNPWDADLENGPRQDVARTGRVFRNATFQRRFLKAMVYGMPVLLVIVTGALLSVLDRPARPAAVRPGLSAVRVQGRALASERVRAWLSEDPAPLPGAHLVSWDGVSRVRDLGGAGRDAKARGDRKDEWPVDVHSLTVAVSSGQVFRAQVAVAVTSAGPVVASRPSLVPYPPVSGQEAKAAWQGAIDVRGLESRDVSLAVTSWAEAYFSHDAGRLRQVVGDRDKGHAYVPMPAATSVTAKIATVSALRPVGESQTASTVIARVSVTPVWGKPQGEGGQAKGASVEFDVLISGASTASPRVVAWGGPGSGPSLKPYQNAVAGLEADPSAPASSEGAGPAGSTGAN